MSSRSTGLRACIVAGLWAALLLPLGATAQSAAAAAAETADLSAALSEQKLVLARAASAVVGLRSMAIEDAASSRTLGRKREGSGVLIDDQGILILTIGYLVLEAEQVEVELDDGRVFPARAIAYDPASGFGLVESLAPLPRPGTSFGSIAAGPASNQPLMFVSGGADGEPSVAYLVSKRPFTGYWEYHIDGALFTVPARGDHSGAGLFNEKGELVGIGALLVRDARGPDQPAQSGNMFVPVELLRPILAELRKTGRSAASRRAWLGINCLESDGKVRVTRVTTDGPADAAGLLEGDEIVAIDSFPVTSLLMLYQRLWQGTPPDREVSLAVNRDGKQQTFRVQATDRFNTLRHAMGI